VAPPFLPANAELLREHMDRLRPEVDWTVEILEGRTLARGGRLWAWEDEGTVVLGVGEPNPAETLFPLMVSAPDEARTQALRGELPWWRVDGSIRLADPGVWARFGPMARGPIERLVHQGAVVGDRRIRISCRSRVFPSDVELLVAFVLLEHWHPVDGPAPPWAADPPDSDVAVIDAWLRSLRGRRHVTSPSEVEPWRRALQDEARARAHLLPRLPAMHDALVVRLVRRAARSRSAEVLLRVPLSPAVVQGWARQAFDGMLAARLAEAADEALWGVWLVRSWRHDALRTARAVEDAGVNVGAFALLDAVDGVQLSPTDAGLMGLGPWLLAHARPTAATHETLARILLELPWEGASIVSATDVVGEEAVASVLLRNLRAGSDLEQRGGEARLKRDQARALTQIETDPTALVLLLRHAPEVAPWLHVPRAAAHVQLAYLRAVAAAGLSDEVGLLALMEATEHHHVKLEAVALLGQQGGAASYRALQALAAQWFLPRDLARAYRTALAQIQDRSRTGALSLVEGSDGGLSLAED